MQDNDISKKNDDGEMEIDLLELAATLWQQRKKLAVWSACGALIGLVIAFSIPKEYATSVKLAPEITDSKRGGGSLGALASMAGFSVGSSSGADAVYPQLYPDVVSSVPFVTSLFDVEVTTKDDKRKMTVRQYLENETKAPWWNVIMGLPFRIIGALHSQEESEEGKAVDNFQLTVDESNLVETINQCVSATVDTKTSVVTIDVRMQDPLVSAVLADTVVARLQEFVTNYRTNKARHDLEYAVKLNEEAKSNYYEAQQRYADFLDRNQGLAFHSAQTMRDRLENEATLAFNLYNQTAQQVQKSQAKVQENTPVYAIVTPATVPVRAVSPRKFLILAGFTFLAFVACAVWILLLSPLLADYKNKKMLPADASEDAKDDGRK